MTNGNNNNKSMFLYTALIFFVAIILIIISFFGQTNLASKQPATVNEKQSTAEMGEGITQRASILSQENVELINENISLKDEISSNEEVISFLYGENDKLKADIENYNLLISVYQYIHQQKTDEAKDILNTVNYDGLTEEQKVIYDDLKNILG